LPQGVAEAGDRGLRPVYLFANVLSALAILLGQRGNVSEQFGIAENGGERVADFVRGAGSEPSESDKLFGLADLSLYGV